MIVRVTLVVISSVLLQVANMIRFLVDSYNKPIPAILEIPSKDHPYDPAHNSCSFKSEIPLLYRISGIWKAVNIVKNISKYLFSNCPVATLLCPFTVRTCSHPKLFLFNFKKYKLVLSTDCNWKTTGMYVHIN
ncbi:UNVERIFIED_CONTAM: V-type proton ATPase subunit F [Sesamum calycinum]|uniref:V-type proton ATPase subunit F n=1 Tax=Sesamum calycinum TaxID=2727403 RepID=A0AAW2SEV3_9LAMI